MNTNRRIVPAAEIRFCDGRRYYVATDSVADFLLHPTFLKYMLACVLIYGLLDRGGADTGHLAGIEIALLWASIASVCMVWYALALSVLKVLWKRGLIRMIYTPLLILPLFVFTTSTTYGLVLLMTGEVMTDPSQWMTEIVRDIIVLLVMDLVFGNYVAPFHPAFSLTPPERREAAAPPAPAEALAAEAKADLAAPQAEMRPPAPALDPARSVLPPDTDAPPVPAAGPADPPSDVLRIGNEAVAIPSIVFVRSNDHYLHVVTRDRRMMVRGRLSEALDQLDYRVGLQVNRSTWLSFAAIADVSEDEKGVLTIALVTGEVERVSQSRRIAVMATLKMQGRVA